MYITMQLKIFVTKLGVSILEMKNLKLDTDHWVNLVEMVKLDCVTLIIKLKHLLEI